MNKKFIKWQFKEWFPLISVMFAIFAVILIPTCLNFEPVKRIIDYKTKYDHMASYSPTYILIIINVISYIFAAMSPIFVYEYRFKKRKVDTYYQLPLNENEFKNTRIILAIFCQIAITTFFYWLVIIILAIKWNVDYSALLNEYTNLSTDSVIYYNYGYMALYYIVLIVTQVCFYFISCFLASLSNNAQSALSNVCLGHFILAAITIAIISIISRGIALENEVQADLISFTPCLHGILAIHYMIFDGYIYPVYSYVNIKSIYIISLVIIFVLGCLAGFYDLFFKDPSGENAGSTKGRYKWCYLIPHIAFILAGILISAMLTIRAVFLTFLTILFFLIIYYLFLCSRNKTFKLKSNDYIFIAITGVMTLILSFIEFASRR